MSRNFRWQKVWKPGLALAACSLLVLLVVRQRFFVAMPVRSATIDRGDVLKEAFGRGTVESRREAQLGFDLVGRIGDIRVDEGDHVRLGQVLATLAPEQFSAEVRTASSGVSLARSAIARLEAEERRAVAALSFAKLEEARAQTLAKTGAVSPRDVDLAVQQLALAHAELDRVQAAHAEAQRQIAVASDNVGARSVTAARAVLVSPFDGLVIRRLHDPGDTVTVGTIILRVVATDALWSRAWIDESALAQLREKQAARVRLGAEGDAALRGRVDRIGREVDRQTHELLVDVLLDVPPARIAIGQRADVWIELDRRRDVVRLPSAFVRHDEEGAFCYVDRGGRIGKTRVTLGLEGSELVEVRTGLAPGQVVLDALSPGGALAEGRRWRKDGP